MKATTIPILHLLPRTKTPSKLMRVNLASRTILYSLQLETSLHSSLLLFLQLPHQGQSLHLHPSRHKFHSLLQSPSEGQLTCLELHLHDHRLPRRAPHLSHHRSQLPVRSMIRTVIVSLHRATRIRHRRSKKSHTSVTCRLLRLSSLRLTVEHHRRHLADGAAVLGNLLTLAGKA